MTSITKMAASLAFKRQLSKINKLTEMSSSVIINQVRMSHTDMEVPDFSYYRRTSTKDSSAKSQTTQER